MGNLLSTDHILDEETLITYVELTYLKRHEILRIIKLLDAIDPGKLRKNPEHRFTIKQIETILPQIRYSPLHGSIYRVFSSKNDGHLGLEDVLDLCSAFSRDCPEDVRAGWAFRIFDLDGDNEISANDLIEVVRRLTRNGGDEYSSIDKAEAEHVARMLFRHGDRTPDKKEIYPKLPTNHIYETLGYGQLTEVGKMRVHRLGKMLRQRYDKFLGKAQYGEVYAISTDFDRTKMSLQLILNGLYSPTTNETQNQIHSSAIPTLYYPRLLDTVLLSQVCPTYVEELRGVKKSAAIAKKLSEYNDLLEHLYEETGKSRDDPIMMVTELYQLLVSQRSMNIPLPEWATENVQKRMEEIVRLDLETQSYTMQLKRLNGGSIVKRFIENIRNTTNKTRPKIYLYSGHDINIASFAKANGFTEPKIPTYGSAIIVETLKNLLGVRFIRMYLWIGTTEKLIPYKIPKCLQSYCPFDLYVAYMQNVIPTNGESECLWNTMTMKRLREYYKLLEY
ncbi:venom acid phosphatase Acph-1-like isoform X2 [Osmia bicornis bicornis]|uniref:venom acid phosphatase Acph-1-like isoform X2 n=1 Tax=Osmia bicornis bicornis TaxID=1437191 RepID=UPI001EAEFFF0|nr:venom acid phosphatase Acph-1-like isoform X2 [Osmia bicornis bicornis]